jgi:hypothetical protein
MVARTTTMEAHLQGTANRLVEQGHDLVKVSTHRGACELCQPWQGKILSITGKTEGYPTLEEAKAAGLFHPNCFSKDTEVYTDQGWRRFYKLSGGEKILSLNPETHYVEWVDYKSVVSYHYTGNMMRFKSNSLDLLVTPDHNMYVGMNSHLKGEKIVRYRLMAAERLKERNFKIPRTAKWEGDTSVKEFMGIPIEQFAKLLGYYLSEGHAEYDRKNRRYRVVISQHDKRNMEIMYNDLKSIGFYECHNRLILSGKELASYFMTLGKAHEKHIPDWFMEQPPEILRLFLDAYALGDGSTREIVKPEKHLKSIERRYFTSSIRLAEQIGECILKVGNYPYFYIQKCGGKKVSFRNGDYIINRDVWVIAENTSPHSVHNASPSCRHRGIQITEEYYDDMVYCAELEKNHVLWVRRNGRTAWCGNCRHAYGLHIDLEDEDKGTERKQELSPEEEKNYIEIEGLSKPAKTSLAKALTEALEHGLKTGTECLLHIDAKTGDSVYSRIEGTINEVVLPQSLIDFLDNAAPNSVIQVHNHPRSSCFSVDDIRNLVYYDSLKAISVIGHDGTRYVMSIGKGQRIDWSTLQKEYNTINKKHFDYFCNQVVSGKMTEQQAWKEHSHRIVMDLAEKYGWEYRRVMPNEK